MIKLISTFRRKEGLTPEEFHTHWREVHAPIIARTKSGQHARRYEQNHRPLSSYATKGLQDWDGVTIQWYDSLEDFQASVMEPDYAEIAADLATFIDAESLVWILTDEEEVVNMGSGAVEKRVS
ncbi:MAG TPA: EthD domain-containing protein [Mycobacteriales bacterium]|nr:EthD domain-containing protein [Mycobacteriales bacterium]